MSGHPARMARRERRHTLRHDGRVIDISFGRGPAPATRLARAWRRRGRSGWTYGRVRTLWSRVCLLAAIALLVIGGRERLLPLGSDWPPAVDIRQPIRATINVSPGRADCRVVRVIDGDTVDLDCAGAGALRARLLGFDTPEVFSPACAAELALGTQATRALERRIRASGDMRIDLGGSDRYGRRLARLSLDGRDVAGPMIAEGLARPYDGGRRLSWCG